MKLHQLKAKFKNQWILARVTKTDASGQADQVEPIAHSKFRADIESKLHSSPEKHVTVIYTGKPKPKL